MRSKHRWAVGPGREQENADGSVRVEIDVKRDGNVVGHLVLVGTAETEDFTNLLPWFVPATPKSGGK